MGVEGVELARPSWAASGLKSAVYNFDASGTPTGIPIEPFLELLSF